MAIWQRPFTLDLFNQTSKNTLVEHLGIEYVAVDDSSLSATMPVDSRTHQPLGMLHGGASVVLAETFVKPRFYVKLLQLQRNTTLKTYTVLVA